MNENSATKGDFTAVVLANKHIRSCYYRLTLQFFQDGARAFAAARPGQFAEFDLSGVSVPPAEKLDEQQAEMVQRDIILRRPFSFCDITAKDGQATVEVLYCAVGPASLRMTTLKPADKINILGPLGNGFSMPQGKKTALLVIGGMGAPPIQHLAITNSRQNKDLYQLVFAGAKTKFYLPFEGRIDEISSQIGFPIHDFARHGIESQLATDDGSAGFAGPVTQCLKQWLDENANETKPEQIVIYACGPEAMLAEVAKIAAAKKIDCQVSMERRMACGIGVCQSCAVECRTDDGKTEYKLCCKDGPVFDAKQVVFEKKIDAIL
ncbi:MAG: dihydroorotate dehydrogenase electron transfer subunit [Phycisphaerae bacterium]|jgi:dihydroorotate dehydrogenase electron transfer subunit